MLPPFVHEAQEQTGHLATLLPVTFAKQGRHDAVPRDQLPAEAKPKRDGDVSPFPHRELREQRKPCREQLQPNAVERAGGWGRRRREWVCNGYGLYRDRKPCEGPVRFGSVPAPAARREVRAKTRDSAAWRERH